MLRHSEMGSSDCVWPWGAGALLCWRARGGQSEAEHTQVVWLLLRGRDALVYGSWPLHVAQGRVWGGEGSSPVLRAPHDIGDLGFPGGQAVDCRSVSWDFSGVFIPWGAHWSWHLEGAHCRPRLRLEALPGRCMGFTVTTLSAPRTLTGKCGGGERRASPGPACGRGSDKGPWGHADCPGIHLLSTWVTPCSGAGKGTWHHPPDLFVPHPIILSSPHLRASPHLLLPCLDPLPIVLSSAQHHLLQEAFLHLRLTSLVAVHACS